MTFQARRLLKKLKKAQIEQDRIVYIDFDAMNAITVHDATQKSETVDLRGYRKSIHSTLRYLAEQEYIEQNNFGHVKVRHTGWHWGQTLFSRFMNFLFESIFVPIVVSLITAFLTIVLSEFF